MVFPPNFSGVQRSDGAFLSKYGALLHMALRIGDVAIVAATAYFVHWLRFDELALQAPYPFGVERGMLLTLLVFPVFGIYRSWRGESVVAESSRLVAAWSSVMLLVLVLEWAFKSTAEYSRLLTAGWFVSCALLLVAARLPMRWTLHWLRARGVDTRRIVLIGGTRAGRKMVAAVRSNPWMGLNVEGYVRTAYDHRTVGSADLPCLGDMDMFIGDLQHRPPDQIWIALPLRAEELIHRILEATEQVPATVRMVPDLFGYALINHHTSAIAGIPVITLRGNRVEGYSRVLKAVFDRIFAACALLALSPLLLAIALGIKLSSPGPVLYRQKRHGMGGKEIEVWKFRSMRVHREAAGKVTQAKRHDPRVTPFGGFLRRTSLDELPQFFNVLHGDMSVVGPRPHAIAHNDYYKSCVQLYMQRHHVKPGITGWAQVNGLRGETDTVDKMAARVEHDMYYLKNWTLWLDLKIVVMTVFKGFVGKTAY